MIKLKRLFSICMATVMITTAPVSSVDAKTGWNTNSKGTYYEYSAGNYADGLVEIDGDLYLFKNNYIYIGWQFDSNGLPLRYFNPFANGKAAKGWVTESAGKIRYFNKKTGICIKGWNKTNGQYRYFYKSTALMAMGWVKTNGQYRYFSKSSGVMATGWVKNAAGEYRYFNKNNGIMQVGWAQSSKGLYYFRPDGVAYVDTVATIGGTTYRFGKDGIAKPL